MQSAERHLLATLALWIAFGLLLGARYLNVRRHVPRLAAIVLATATATGAVAILIIRAGWLLWPSLFKALAGVAGGVLPFGSQPTPGQGHRITGGYLFSSCVMLLLTLLKLTDAWVVPLLPVMDQPLQITFTLPALVFALGHGQRMPTIVKQHGALRNQARELAHR